MEADVNEEQVKAYIRSFYQDNPFVQYLHIDVTSIEADHVVLDIDIVHNHTNVYKIAHGGVLMSLADTAMGAACLSRNKRVVTLDCSMNFLRAVPVGKHVRAIGRVQHDGLRTMVCTAEVRDAEGQVFALAHGTFFVTKKLVD